MRKQQKRFARILALVLAILLVLGTLASVLFSHAHAEAAIARDTCQLELMFFKEEQALQVRQRLRYTNRTGGPLDRVVFSAYANMFRRATALMYETDVWQEVFPVGNAPGGIELSRVLVDGEAADWGMQGEEELFLRVACDLADGQTCEFTFEYTLLLSENGASLGVGDTDWRLRGFYLQPLKYEYGEFVAPEPLQHANYVYADRADYALTVTLPERYLLAGPGEVTSSDNGDGTRTWTLAAKNIRELCLSFGMRWREYSAETSSGTRLRLLSNARGAQKTLDTALAALEAYERWFGPLAWDVTIAQSDYALEALSLPGFIWASGDGFNDAMALRRALAKQFFGYGAYPMPTEDAWLSDSVSAYAACLALKEAEGESAFLEYLNGEILPEAQYTLPGGVEVTSSAAILAAGEYESLVLGRGALVMHEMRTAMGEETFFSALRLFYERGLETDVVGEYDLVSAFDDASGGDWEAFLTDWLFNVAEYYVEDYTLDSID